MKSGDEPDTEQEKALEQGEQMMDAAEGHPPHRNTVWPGAGGGRYRIGWAHRSAPGQGEGKTGGPIDLIWRGAGDTLLSPGCPSHRRSSRGTSPPPHDYPEEPDSACQEEPGPAAEALETSAHLAQQESRTTLSGMGSTVWTIGSRISHWRLAHQRGYHVDQLTQNQSYRHRLRKHERDCKAAITGGIWGQGTRSLTIWSSAWSN
nr:uncharacterized protein LOC101935587 [Chrysemys picta bellii]